MLLFVMPEQEYSVGTEGLRAAQDVISQKVFDRALQINPYGEQPHDLAIEAAELETEATYPSLERLSPKAQEYAKRDLDKLTENLKALRKLSNTSTLDYSTIGKIESLVGDNPVLVDKNHDVLFQKAWAPTGEQELPSAPFFITAEYEALRLKILSETERVISKVDPYDKYSQSSTEINRARLKALEDTSPDSSLRIKVDAANKKIAELDFGEWPIYHGLGIESLLDVLDSDSLLCRSKQINSRGKARLNTSRGKRTDQEMFNVSFSNIPDRGYTDTFKYGNSDIAFVTPDDIWVVSDLGSLIKGGERFFYTDGWQMMGKKDQDGFKLSFSEDPFVLLVTEEALTKIKNRIATDMRFADKDMDGWIDNHVVIIPNFPSKTGDLNFNMDESVKHKIKQKFQENNPNQKLPKNNGYLVPSGELFDDQGGKKVMSFCWIEKQ